MAFKRKTYKGVYEDTNEYFVCDTQSDLQNLPSNSEQGSMAFVIEDSTCWMINSSGQWVQITMLPGGISPFGVFGASGR